MEISGYNTSIDYEKLHELIVAGQEVVCFVRYDFRHGKNDKPLMATDICTAKLIKDNYQKRGFYILVGCRGLTFIDTSFRNTREYFIDNCKHYKLEYLIPNEVSDGNSRTENNKSICG